MKVEIDKQEIDVIVVRKRSNKRTYLRVKEDLKIYITTNYLTKDKEILNFIYNNQEFIKKNLNLRRKQHSYENKFYYLGKEYDIIYLNSKDVILKDNILFINKNTDIDKWLKKQASIIFKSELDKIYNIFPRMIPYPTLTIRLMKTRWGVCNVKTKRVTLNLGLIKKDIKYIDYVIVHELSHLIYPNHSSDFWSLVNILVPNYKKLRKELNSYE